MPSCNSTGDILRELDNCGVLRGNNFVLVNAGAITNLNLAPIWKEHESRWLKSSYNAMTSVFTHIPYNSNVMRSRDLAMIVNSDNRILAYGDIKGKDFFSVLTSSLLESDSVVVSLSYDLGISSI